MHEVIFDGHFVSILTDGYSNKLERVCCYTHMTSVLICPAAANEDVAV